MLNSDLFTAPFMIHAWISASLVAVLCAFTGFFVVLRGSAFAAHALPKAGFAGAAGAVFLAINPLYGLVAFAVGGALSIGVLGKSERHDVVTALILVAALGTGDLFLSLTDKYATGAYAMLFGQIVGVSAQQVWDSVVHRFRLFAGHRLVVPAPVAGVCFPRGCRIPRYTGQVTGNGLHGGGRFGRRCYRAGCRRLALFQSAYWADCREQLPDLPPQQSDCPGPAVFPYYRLGLVDPGFLFRMADWLFCCNYSGTFLYMLKGGWFPEFRRQPPVQLASGRSGSQRSCCRTMPNTKTNQNSLTVGKRGRVLLQDVHLIEKLAHFDRQRIPE